MDRYEEAALYEQIAELQRENWALQQRLDYEIPYHDLVAQYRAILNAIPDLILRINRAGIVVGYRASRELGPYVPPNQFVGRHVSEIISADAAERFLVLLDMVLTTGQMQVFEYRLPGGSAAEWRDFEARIALVSVDEVVSVVRDVTSRKRAEQHALRSERLAALGLMAAALAHEVNNPLQIMQSHLDLVLDFDLSSAEKEQYLHIIHAQIERLSFTTQRILNFANPQKAQRQPTTVVRPIRHVLVLAANQLQQKHISISTDFQPSSHVMADPDELAQLVLNLILNAVESMNGGGKIHIATYELDEHVVIAMSNNGPAIPDNDLPHIFEPLYTTKTEGSGLGLWLSHEIVQRYGGTLSAENLPNNSGVLFKVKLPIATEI